MALSADAWTNQRKIILDGDVTGNVWIDGSANVTITTELAANSVVLGSDTTGDYLANLVAGTGITITDNSGEGMTPVIAVTSGTFDTAGSAASAESNAVAYASSAANTAYSNAVSYVDSKAINDLSDVTIADVANGDFLRYNGSVWINDPVNLSTDTVGNYVQSLIAGSGIEITNNSGEGSTPTISLNSEFTLTANGDVDGSALISNLSNSTLTLTIANASITSDKLDLNYVEGITAGNNIELIGEIGLGALAPEISVSDDPSFNTVTTNNIIVDGIEISTNGATTGQILKFDGSKFVPDEDLAEAGLGTVSKYSETIGDGSNTSYTITHSLGTRDVIVEVYETTYYETVVVAVKRTSINAVQLDFSTPPPSSSRRVVING